MSDAITENNHLPNPVTAVIIVDHGSRKAASNEMLHEAVAVFSRQSQYSIVEPAHMEIAQPDIETAFRTCVDRGAERVIVFPYFLSPGRHWSEDIPHLVAAAAVGFPEIEWLVTAPFGLHSGMATIINDRIKHCLSVASGEGGETSCEVCKDSQQCSLRSGE